MAGKTLIEIEDVGGSFKRFCREAPKEARAAMKEAVTKTANRVSDEMYDRAPDRSDAPPHVKDAIDVKQTGLSALVGILEGDAPSGTEATMGEVAQFNEYAPNKQPFMLPAAAMSERPAAEYARKALAKLEQVLSGGL